MNSRIFAKRLLLAYYKLIRITYDGFDQVTEIPKKVREFEKKIQTEFIS